MTNEVCSRCHPSHCGCPAGDLPQVRLSSGKVDPAMLLRERGLDWVRPALLPCQWVQPCPDGHETSSHLIHPGAGSFSMQWGCPVVCKPGVGGSQHLSPGQSKNDALQWAATALPLGPCLSFPLKDRSKLFCKGLCGHVLSLLKVCAKGLAL